MDGSIRVESNPRQWFRQKEVMTKQEYPVQLDCVWVASDRDGHVAAFVTAGIGPIPALVLNNPESLLVQEIEEAILRLPKVSASRLIASVPRPDSFIAMAERGFFVYDWSDVHRTVSLIDAYEPMACPVNPVSLDKLPESLRSHAARVRYSAGTFDHNECLKAKNYFECLSAS
jgi:hypothetical protein